MDIIITITVPDASAMDILETITNRLGYDGEGTREDFLRKEAAAQMKGIYRSAKAEQAMTAVKRAEADADLVSFA